MNSTVPGSTLVRRRAVLWSALGLLLFSLTFIQRVHNGWYSEGEYDISAERFLAGVPIPWTSLTWVSATGTPPPLATLPEGNEWRPDLRVDFIALLIAAGSALLLSCALVLTTTWVRKRLQRQGALPTRRAVLVVGLGGVLLGASVPTDPNWIGVGLAFALILTLGVATWRTPRFLAVLSLVIIAIFAMWWTQRISSHFWTRLHTIEGFSLRDDLAAPVVWGAVALLCVMSLHTVRHLFARVASRVRQS